MPNADHDVEQHKLSCIASSNAELSGLKIVW